MACLVLLPLIALLEDRICHLPARPIGCLLLCSSLSNLPPSLNLHLVDRDLDSAERADSEAALLALGIFVLIKESVF